MSERPDSARMNCGDGREPQRDYAKAKLLPHIAADWWGDDSMEGGVLRGMTK